MHPWPREVLAEELARDHGRVMVVRDGSELIAFIVFWWVVDELSILNLGTDPSRRRSGLAARLLEHAIAWAHRLRCRRVMLEVRRSNRPAIQLYRKYGFRPVAVRAGYYAIPPEDALVMRLELQSKSSA